MADEYWLTAPFDDYLFESVDQTENMVAVIRNPQHTFLPSGIEARATSTLACARTSAEADMLTRKSVTGLHQH